ncbi:MAG: c-type cytochrome, partial [bacterium]
GVVKAGSSAKAAAWAEDIATLVAARARPEELARLLEIAFTGEQQKTLADPVLNGLAQGAARGGKNLGSLIPESRKDLLNQRISAALATIRDTRKPAGERISAIRLARLGSSNDLAGACETMLTAENAPTAQLAAVQTLSALNRPGVADLLVGRWKDLGPTQRREVVEALFARPERLSSLVKGMETEVIPLTEVDPARRSQLLESKNAEIASRAKKLFASLPSLSRADVLKAYAPATKLEGKWDAGEAVFKKVCSTCHKAGGSAYGAEVGPNLQTVISRSPEDLLGHIIEPNREIAPQYLNYSVAMKDGRVLTGMIASESSNSIVLKRAEGVLETVPRVQIEEVRSTGQSLMPEGLENGLKPQDFADLILFIKQIGSR